MIKTEISKIKKGDWLSRISFMRVTNTGFMNTSVKNEDGMEWSIGNAIVAGECYSTKYDTIETVTKTELAEKLMSAMDAVVEVSFHKQATASGIMDRMVTFSGEAKLTKKEIESVLKGDERILTGYVVGTEPVLGRSILIDLEVDKVITNPGTNAEHDSRVRQVDHRTLNWLIYKNVKYVLK